MLFINDMVLKIGDIEEDDDFNYFETDDCGFCPIGECDCYDDICCYDRRYTGLPNTCHCAEWHKEEERANHWFFKHWDVFYYHHWRNVKHFFSSPIFSSFFPFNFVNQRLINTQL